jgi:hypothetical protein
MVSKVVSTTFTVGVAFHTPRHLSSRRLAPYKGVHPKLVCEMLGHSSLSITLGSYRHLIPGLGEIVASAMKDDHAGLLTHARLQVLSWHPRLLLGALPARWCDGPGLPRRAPRQPCFPSHLSPLSLKAFSFCYALRASGAGEASPTTSTFVFVCLARVGPRWCASLCRDGHLYASVLLSTLDDSPISSRVLARGVTIPSQ